MDMAGTPWTDSEDAILAEGTVAGWTPDQLCERLPGRSKDSIRSRRTTLKLVKTRAKTPVESDDDQLALIRKLDAERVKLKAQLKAERKRREHTEAALCRIEDTGELLAATQDRVTARKLDRRQKKRDRGQATAILCATDWHCEERIDGDEINGLNHFDLDVAKDRIGRTWEKFVYLIDFARGISDIRELVVWLGGDLINGWIHEELEESNFLGPSEAVLFAQEQVASGLDHLLRQTDCEITVVTSMGNHGRSTKQKRITAYKASWEWVLYNNLAGYYRNEPRLRWQIEKGYHSWLDVQGHAVRFHHGDGFSGGGGMGGITPPVNKAIGQWNKAKVAALDIFGHFHQYVSMWNWTCVGCVCGFNPYALSIKADPQPPTQGFIVVDRQYGKVMSLPVFCEDKT